MNRRQTGLLLALLLVAPCLAYAQGSPAEKKQPSAQMYEDIEVMRRILNRSLHLPRHGTRSVWVPGNNNFGSSIGNLGGGLGALGGNITTGTNQGQGTISTIYGGGLGALGGMVGGQNVNVASLEYPGAEGVYLK